LAVIRQANAGDRDWIRDVAAEVYRNLGDYGAIIPSWLDHSGVLAFVDEGRGRGGRSERRGFTLLGFYIPEADHGAELRVADLLAIAVAPAFQGRGIGKALLSHAVAIAREFLRARAAPEIRLTVAEGNQRALALFSQAGFSALDQDYGAYDGGQRAIRMFRSL
jgi:ribosomal protein S18 acetylase RimI-like enzyme